jgi:hypothetical protein
MTTRTLHRGLASLLTLAGLAGVTLAAEPVLADGHGHGATIRLTEASAHPDPTVVDTGKPGLTVGDQVVLRDGVNRADGGPAGTLTQVCTLVAVGGDLFTSTFECTGSIALDEGTLVIDGPFLPTAPEQAQAVSGGTGAFRAAAGQADIRAEADQIVVHLAR